MFFLSLVYRAFQLQREAIRLALHDPLTSLPNRESLRKAGEALLAAGRSLAVLVLDIDRFKSVNAALGRQLGDRILVLCGQRLSQLDADMVGRLHADRFALLWASNRSLSDLQARIEQLFAEPVELDGQQIDLSAKVGVATGSGAHTNIETVMRNAEVALNTARSQQKTWVEYRPEYETTRLADLSLLSDLNRAVERNELRLYLQPKVRLADGATAAAEALIRWQHPQRGLVPPMEFIPFAEQTGRIGLLTRWMLGEAMQLTARLRREGRPLQVSVNLSTVDLAERDFDQFVSALAERHGALPADIRLEVTESSAMLDPKTAISVMQKLHAAGFSLSIDDFGTGYSSLAYLQKMPVAELKIDRAFVRGVVDGSDAATLLSCTLDLGHRLGLTVVAEGAETLEEWMLLTKLGCDYAQGWFAAKPMPIEAFEHWREEYAAFLPVILSGSKPA
ncbi:putative bifunctional diguanylate cyclase/phosphodiesterase [Chitinimonas sp.]|uniref:putative bifunctional diguanylate cyclase/phosphodiesterase n=1 Tax=Chitinimonas sp. TaxID=1934313 RepID=UPI0035B23EB0